MGTYNAAVRQLSSNLDAWIFIRQAKAQAIPDFGGLVVLDVSVISRRGWSNSPVKWRAQYEGQWLNNPPSVEGWHQGADWLDTGPVVERVNFATKPLGDASIRTARH